MEHTFKFLTLKKNKIFKFNLIFFQICYFFFIFKFATANYFH